MGCFLLYIQIMARLFYILFVVLLVVSCSGNNPLWYTAPARKKPQHSFSIEYVTMPHDSFPLHYAVDSVTQENSDEYYYSSFRTEGDTVVWEEGRIRMP